MKIHHGKYSYPQTIFRINTEKVIITCPIHGDFQQTPKMHLNGTNCRLCSYKNNSEKYTRTKEQFINLANKKHLNKYSYDKSIYVGCKIPLIITCPIHGDFQQLPANHLIESGCSYCSHGAVRQILFERQI